MNPNRSNPPTPSAILAGLLPFLLVGLMFTLKGINYHTPIPLMSDGMGAYLVGLIFLTVGLGVGWAKGFPRWSYAYLGGVLIHSQWLSGVVTVGYRLFGYTFGHEEWGWRGWLPLLVLTAVMLLLARSFKPLGQMIQGIKQDWTLLSFALFAALSWLLLSVAYDGKTWYDQTVFLPLNLLLQTLIITGGAFFYLRLSRPWPRVLLLSLVIILTVPVSALLTTLAGYSGATTTAVGRIVLPFVWLGYASVPLWPGIVISFWRRFAVK
ncbi:MAG: hypothetical protein KC445_10880 [Anaerolineales bacterium]|nr:hypothetical protein [Anaerolineales bacterium]